MLFTSADYAVFLVAILGAYWCLPRRPQNVLLLAGSYFFYGYVHHWFLLLILASTIVDYASTRGMVAFPAYRRVLLWTSVCANLSLLGFFKYFGFFVESVGHALEAVGLEILVPGLQVVLPVGISFYTFQTLGYTIDVYRGRVKARTDFVDYALYVAFFPQLVAGPIERAGHFLPQIERNRRFEPDAIRDGLLLLAWGFFQKLVVANNAAVIANKVFLLSDPGFLLLWTGVLAFGLQIFADFSGYTDIARGSAKLLGFDLMANFRHPYLSQSPTEFWQRWHISLSSWFRDYVYIPLGGNRANFVRRTMNLMLTFLLSGLWHGASWNFALWGLYCGTLILVYRGISALWPAVLRMRTLAAPRVAVCFALTHVGWLFFRERDIAQVWAYLTLDPFGTTDVQRWASGYFMGLLLVYSLPLALYTAIDVFDFERRLGGQWLPGLARAALLGILILATLTWHSTVQNDFIYFRF